MALAESPLALGVNRLDRPAIGFRWLDPLGLFAGWHALAALDNSAEVDHARTALRYDLVRLVG